MVSSVYFADFGNRPPLWFSFLFLSLRDWSLGVEMNSLSSQSQKQFLRRKEKEPRHEKENYHENLSLGECARVPFYFTKRFLSLCSLVLSTQISISFCLVACQILALKLGGLYDRKNLNSWLGIAVPLQFLFPSHSPNLPLSAPSLLAWCVRDGIESPVLYIPKKIPGTLKASSITDEVGSWSDLDNFILL